MLSRARRPIQSFERPWRSWCKMARVRAHAPAWGRRGGQGAGMVVTDAPVAPGLTSAPAAGFAALFVIVAQGGQHLGEGA